MLPDKTLCGREGGGVGNNLTRQPPSKTHPPHALVADNMALVWHWTVISTTSCHLVLET